MKQKFILLTAAVSVLGLSACGSESPEPVEQIVVREPGQVETATPDAAAVQDAVAVGRAAFAACVACHTVESGEASGAGPNLAGLVGRIAGSVDDYVYSDALKNSGLTWTVEELDAFLADPAAKVPGTTMAVGAVSDAEKRSAIVAYLASLAE